MLDLTLRHRALAHLDAGIAADGPSLCERPFTAKLNLRGDPADAGFRSAVEAALGVPLPVAPNTAAGGGAVTVLWLGPDEWLVSGAAGREAGLAADLRAALGETLCAVTDVTEAQTIIALGGARARAVLRKGCRIDLHPRAFRPGQCAQTALAKAQVLLHQTGDAPDYDIYVDRSFAEYLWLWLDDASLEFRHGADS